MIGNIIGDVCGSHYEFLNEKGFSLPTHIKGSSSFTDDTALTLATIAKLEGHYATFTDAYRAYYNRYSCYSSNGVATVDMGYGALFQKWAMSKSRNGYKSIGNGAAMRVAPIAYISKDTAELLKLAQESAQATHDTNEGIASAKAVALAVFLSHRNTSVEEIKKQISIATKQHFAHKNPYTQPFCIHTLHDSYKFTALADQSVPQAIFIGLAAESFEEAIRMSLYIGGDTDTIACIAGGIAEARFGLPSPPSRHFDCTLALEILKECNKEDFEMLELFYARYVGRHANDAPHLTLRRRLEWIIAEKVKGVRRMVIKK